MKWLQALGKAALAGGILVCAPQAANMAIDGFSVSEWRALLSSFVSGALGGMSGLFINTPRSSTKRTRSDDKAARTPANF
jgi:hypothetical protein